jgi:signal transduction histidine kinase
MSMLVVDDDPAVRLMLETILRDSGYSEVVTAESAIQAFRHLGMEDSDTAPVSAELILMDISMPEINGVEACRRIKSVSRLKDIPIMMVTGLADSKDLEAAFAAGATDYIIKPPNIVEMLARVRSATDVKREMDRRKSAYISDLEAKNRELERAFAQLEQKNRELEEASLAKTQILTTSTHELKTPLTSIIGYVDRILMRQDSVGQLNVKQQRYLETVQKNAHRLKALVDELLDVSRIEAGILELTLLDLEVGPEVEDVVQSMRNQLSDKQIKLDVAIPSDLPGIRADRLRFWQVISNLLSNACKYSPAGSTVTVTASEKEGMIQIDIADTGIGISSKDQARLFTKFFRADNSPTREVSGTGLGLYITKHLVEAHGGSIWTESRLGQGTTFHFTWKKAATLSKNGATPSQARPALNT